MKKIWPLMGVLLLIIALSGMGCAGEPVPSQPQPYTVDDLVQALKTAGLSEVSSQLMTPDSPAYCAPEHRVHIGQAWISAYVYQSPEKQQAVKTDGYATECGPGRAVTIDPVAPLFQVRRGNLIVVGVTSDQNLELKVKQAIAALP